MNEMLLGLLGAGQPIEPTTVVALPMAAFWTGLVSLFAVAASLVTITYRISTFTTRVEMDLSSIKDRVNNHSDLFGENEKTHHDLDKRLSNLEPRHA